MTIVQNWKKLGLIYCPDSQVKHMYSHAAVPIAEQIAEEEYKIYFTSRDSKNRSFTNSLTMNIGKPEHILDVSKTPILAPGKLGTFDDSGAMASWLAKKDQFSYLYYIGWNLGKTVPFRNSIGLATSCDGKLFKRLADGPIVDRSMDEPYFCASCCVIPGEKIWRMWYLSCTEWRLKNGLPEHRYHIKYAESEDGIQWQRNGLVAIDYLNEDEIAISRPSVLYEDNIWKMWFSCRSTSSTYRIGYAESRDGKVWNRLSNSVLPPSVSGWDADMVEYPFVFNHEGVKYMLYNGNDFGRTGFGLAILEN